MAGIKGGGARGAIAPPPYHGPKGPRRDPEWGPVLGSGGSVS